MECDLIETPENVELEQRLAGIGSRFGAGLVDTSIIVIVVLIGVLTLVLLDGTDVLGAVFDSDWMLAFLIIVLFLLIWGYFAAFELFGNGQTPGKRYMKIRVVKEGGGAISFSEVAIRNLLRSVDGWPLYPVAGVVMFVTNKCQRLGDLAAGTVVISEGLEDYSAHSDRRKKRKTLELTEEVSAEALRKSRLTPEEFRVLSSYRNRRDELTLDARERLLERLLPPILNRLGRPTERTSLSDLEWQVDHLLGGSDVDERALHEEEPA